MNSDKQQRAERLEADRERRQVNKIVMIPPPPPGYLNVPDPDIPVLSCERCGALVVLPPVHDAWHRQQAMRL